MPMVAGRLVHTLFSCALCDWQVPIKSIIECRNQFKLTKNGAENKTKIQSLFSHQLHALHVTSFIFGWSIIVFRILLPGREHFVYRVAIVSAGLQLLGSQCRLLLR